MTNNGRTVGHRNNVKSGYCASCGLRILVGDPSPGEGMWPAKLHIESDQMAELMRAAAEIMELAAECVTCHHPRHAGTRCPGEKQEFRIIPCACRDYAPRSSAPTPVEFVDWVWPDAVSEGFASPVNLSPEATSNRHKGAA
jgi:hypothetical protein